MSSFEPNPIDPDSIPMAVVRPKARLLQTTRFWWITFAVLIGTFILVVGAMKSGGPIVAVRFPEGHGLKPGDLLKFRGIAIGEVHDVSLDSASDQIVVHIQLEKKAASLARRGSLFWIERPRVGMSRVSGLETVVGPKFVGMVPGPSSEPVISEFVGAESPPTLSQADAAEILIRFREGNGLQAGAPLRHRGIDIGEVVGVDLAPELNSVSVRVRLVGESHRLAREGTQFWIERPRLSLAEVRGLDTLVGGRYLAVSPGPRDASEKFEFDGLESAATSEIPEGSLELILHAPQRWGIDRGSPVSYRGLRVGQVISVGLASDGTSIEARAYVEPQYRLLVRQNSVFWSNSGVDLSIGFTGVQFSTENLAAIAQGGIAFATPADPGSTVNTGHRYSYQKSPKDEWLTWQPRIAAAEGMLPNRSPLPEPRRAVARWGENKFMVWRNGERTGWILPLENGSVLGPVDLLSPTFLASTAVRLEFDGDQFTIATSDIQQLGSLALYHPASTPSGMSNPWPINRIQTNAEPQDCLVISGAHSGSVPIAVNSIGVQDGLWTIRGTNGLSADHHGAPVISAKDGQLIGGLLFHRGKASISPIEPLPGTVTASQDR